MRVAALALLLALGSVAAAAQGSRPSAAQVHPELVDSTWGPRMQAAWRLAWANRWRDANDAFAQLRREQPGAMEPLVGLAFVARGESRLRDARVLYREALARDPGAEDVRRQALELEWTRPGSLEVLMGQSRSDVASTNLLSLAVVAPLVREITLLTRAGVLSGSDAQNVGAHRLADSASATLLSAGAVLHFTESVWLTPRVERWWSGGERRTYGWLDAAWRTRGPVTVLGSVRTVFEGGSPLFAAGAELAFSRTGDVLTFFAMHAPRPEPGESDNQFRAFFTGAATRRVQYRIVGAVERGGSVEATTIGAGATWFVHPELGLRLELSQRAGFASQHAALAGLVSRW